MPELLGHEREEFASALEVGAKFAGYVNFVGRGSEAAAEHCGGWSHKGIVETLCEYAVEGGKISRTEEQREGWRDVWKYCYHMWPVFNGKKLYFELRFDNSSAEDFEVQIVNIHVP